MVRTTKYRRGLTLIETLMGIVIVSMLVGAMWSLVTFTSRLAPGRSGTGTTAASEFLEQLQADVAAARGITTAEATAIEVKLADRNGDNTAETVRYQWSGKPGDPIERVYNGVSVKLSALANTFAIRYAVVTSQTTGADTVAAQPEASVGGWAGGTLVSRTVDSNRAVAQHFIPTLPAGTRSWTITRVRFDAASDLFANGTTDVQLRTVGADGKPTGTILATASVAESSLSLLGGTRGVTFTGAPPLAPGQEVAIVFWCSSNCPSMSVSYAVLGSGRTPPMSINGPTWSTLSTGVVPHEVFATVEVASTNTTTAKRIERITVQMSVPQSSAVLRSTFAMQNQPEVQ